MSQALNTNQLPTWCPGCGAFVVGAAIKNAITNKKLQPKNVVICYDIGCSGNMANLIDVCGFATLHGRSIPVACGVKKARPELTVIAQAGDGGLLNEGLNHFVHAARRNDRITLILNNNQIFGLTAGQQSSATPKNAISRVTGKINETAPLSAVDLAVASGAKFIARVPETDLKLMQEIIQQAIGFEGFALVEIIQPCKIWARDFKKTEFRKITKPFKRKTDLIGQNNLIGLLYWEK